MQQLHIMSYGAYLHVKDEMFEVRIRQADSQEIKTQQFAPTKVKLICLGKSTMLSTAAVALAVRHNVDIVFVESDGQPIGRVWHSKLGSTTRIRKHQLAASLGALGLRQTKQWIHHKMNNQRSFIQDLKKHRPHLADYLNEKIARIEALQISVQTLEAKRVQDIAETLRGLEGTAGRLYFETLSHVMPPEYKFAGRSMRPARDAYNACLNYSYGMLYSQVEKALIIAGIDPYVGFLHRDDYNQLSMVYDFIEPYRIFAEKPVFHLFTAKQINKAYFEELPQGISLNKEGKNLIVQAFLKHYEEEKIKYEGKLRTRAQILQLEAHHFAQRLLNLPPEEIDIVEMD